MSEAANNGVTKRELLIFLYKYRLRLYTAFFLPFLLFVAASFIPAPHYQASSVLIIRLGSEYVYQPMAGNGVGSSSQAIPFDRDQIFKSEVAILSSDDLHAQVIQTVGLEKLYPDLVHPTGFALVVSNLKKRIDQTLEKAGLASKDNSTDEEKEQTRLATAVATFDKNVTILLEKESAVINITFEHKDRALAVNTLDTLLKLYFEKRKQLFLSPQAGLVETELQDKRERMEAADLAVEKFKRDHHLYSLEDEIANLLDRRSEAEEEATKVASAGSQQKIASYNKQLDQLDAIERDFHNLQREAQIAQNSYNLYSGKLDQAKSSEDMERQRADSVRVIQSPTVPPEPKRLQFLIILGGLFISLLCMLAVAAYTEFSQSGFLTPEQIERTLRLPVIGIFPLHKHS